MKNDDKAESAGISIANLPLPLFAGTMGLAGLALVWHQVEGFWGRGEAFAEVIGVLAAIVFVAMLLAYASKLALYRQESLAEITHPVRLNFLPAVSISLILLGMLAGPGQLSLLLWGGGAALHLAFMLGIVTSWLLRQLDLNMLNPAWFIPAVGNVLVPIPAANAGYTEVAWFFFAVGIFFWLILMTLCYHRLIFGANLPEFLQPTLAVLLAPPAVGYLAWVSLTGEAETDIIGRMLYYKALFTFFLLLVQVPRLIKIPFYPSWWAYTFPLAAFSLASFHYVENLAPNAEPLLMALVGLTTLVILWVFVFTVVALLNGRLLKPE
ncbi:SLAC1 anion channel family protein [Halorhodospira halochloris]|uniref:SLAC1 anion channel family protein n=1 Tax=Halorhodospira halochloris TaxID=1052 RepID=UPI00237808FF|nr:SLAC1 anion channel family protein [Halorhodospira halochloris]